MIAADQFAALCKAGPFLGSLLGAPPASPEEIRRFAASQVAGYKQIRRLEVTDAIPKSASGKILRKDLRGLP